MAKLVNRKEIVNISLNELRVVVDDYCRLTYLCDSNECMYVRVEGVQKDVGLQNRDSLESRLGISDAAEIITGRIDSRNYAV